MHITVKTFGAASDIMGGKNVRITLDGTTVGDLRKQLSVRHPGLDDLRSLFIAVNLRYADDDTELHDTDEIALIPPVSGG